MPSAYFHGNIATRSDKEVVEELPESICQNDDPLLFERSSANDYEVLSLSSFESIKNDPDDELETQDGVFSNEWGFFVPNGYYKDGFLHDLHGFYDEEGYYHRTVAAPVLKVESEVMVENSIMNKEFVNETVDIGVPLETLHISPDFVSKSESFPFFPEVIPRHLLEVGDAIELRKLALSHARSYYTLLN